MERVGPDERVGGVPPEAVRALLASVDACAGHATHASDLVDVPLTAERARWFKLDVSFALTAARHARFSVNDKGEPIAFRDRAERLLPRLGLPAGAIRRFFDVAAPGRVQTTLAVKWSAAREAPDRITLYLEELARDRHHAQIRRDVFGLGGLAAPAVPDGAVPVAVCIDYARGVPVAFKSYDMFVDGPGAANHAVPPALVDALAALPAHPVSGTRRYMLASRTAPDGTALGHKLLWITEVHRPELGQWAWAHVDAWRASWAQHAHPAVARALDELRARWAYGPGAFLSPDLVCLNADASGERELIVYVSLR